MNQQEEYEHIEQCALNAYTELFNSYLVICYCILFGRSNNRQHE